MQKLYKPTIEPTIYSTIQSHRKYLGTKIVKPRKINWKGIIASIHAAEHFYRKQSARTSVKHTKLLRWEVI